MTHNASLSRCGKPYVTIAQAKECLRKAGYIVTKPSKTAKSKEAIPHVLPPLTLLDPRRDLP